LLGASGAIAQATSGPSLCAGRDVELVIMIEDHGAANDVAPEKLYKAGLAQMDIAAAILGYRPRKGLPLWEAADAYTVCDKVAR
jgi:hypothetical protein